jgi:hypothetical protein
MNNGNFRTFNIPSRRKTSKKTPINAEMRMFCGALGIMLLAYARLTFIVGRCCLIEEAVHHGLNLLRNDAV